MHSNCVHLNYRFLSRMVTPTVLHLPHLSRCERTQRKSDTSVVGSFDAFAASRADVRYSIVGRIRKGGSGGEPPFLAIMVLISPISAQEGLWLAEQKQNPHGSRTST
jgi:hypothetical protein